ncbi:MAG: SSU ribosomal protein S11P [Candidatus Magasanikbacteria bacterium GW2011_GWA2_56_11]|uniref:Small ribosomal subunit protein uS11 n=1 Tax=Candidatus Magasanikbacteria bacterium GW2011_GWA2_56_11 TaxID=1619044 RepID=A0A0G1YEM8_9BACT|nr:MAG: SSU ribosomal protein S11P [Candidatus Magasanikbacteria bacterium GW2011_GWA2_56_11]
MADKKTSKKKKVIKAVSHGRAYIQASFNNTIVTVTDTNGDVIGWGSAGGAGFKGPKKSTPYAAGIVVKKVVEAIKAYGLKEVNVLVKGIGGGREAAIRAFNTNGVQVLSVRDITPTPHNGCRAPRRRRV